MRRNIKSLSATVLPLLATWACTLAYAAVPYGHEHQSLETDPSLTLGQVVEATLATYPDTPVLNARQEQAVAWSRRGDSLIQDRPSLLLRYQTDRWGSDVGLDEYEAGVAFPLWSWGGRSATQAFGDAMMSESNAARNALYWEIAGVARQLLWNVALADNAHELAEQSLETAARLVATVERRYELGDVAQRDLLLARSSYLEYETALIEANAALLDAERTYRAVTGLGRRPHFVAETLSATGEITSDHPALALANKALERANAEVEVTRQTSNTGATVLVGFRRERPAFGTFLDDSVGFTVNIPFGGGKHRDTAITTALRTASEALAARNGQLRTLTLEMHEAAHSLAVVRENYASASRRLEIAERQLTMAESAYEQGEIGLLDRLKITETAIAARRHAFRLQIDEKRQMARYNQAAGELP